MSVSTGKRCQSHRICQRTLSASDLYTKIYRQPQSITTCKSKRTASQSGMPAERVSRTSWKVFSLVVELVAKRSSKDVAAELLGTGVSLNDTISPRWKLKGGRPSRWSLQWRVSNQEAEVKSRGMERNECEVWEELEREAIPTPVHKWTKLRRVKKKWNFHKEIANFT